MTTFTHCLTIIALGIAAFLGAIWFGYHGILQLEAGDYRAALVSAMACLAMMPMYLMIVSESVRQADKARREEDSQIL